MSVVQVLLSGLQIGSIYALSALSYYVIIIAAGILNFAQGALDRIANEPHVFPGLQRYRLILKPVAMRPLGRRNKMNIKARFPA
jgi:hypothetical protein